MVSEQLVNSVKSFYLKLEQLSKDYEELTDTDVRESLHMVLSYYFVWGKSMDRLPISYGMFSLEGDNAVANAVNQFLSSIFAIPEIGEVTIGKERLALLQNKEIKTHSGSEYDDFIGHSDEPLSLEILPEDLFEEVDYDY